MQTHNSLVADTLHFDVLIVGSGLAGLSAALLLSSEKRVAVITKRAVSEGSSGWAQGGIAAVWSKDDSFDAHVDDTLVAGAGLCDLAATRFVVENAPKAIAWLQTMGVPFSEEDGQLHLTREGGHSARRIVHVAKGIVQLLFEQIHGALFICFIIDVYVNVNCPDGIVGGLSQRRCHPG